MRGRWIALLLLLALGAYADDLPRQEPDGARVDDAIRKGVSFLVSQRQAGGFWKTDARESCSAEGFHVTSGALACLALMETRDMVKDEAARQALVAGVEWLADWGVHSAKRPASDRED